jgi:chemotaxis protein CheD
MIGTCAERLLQLGEFYFGRGHSRLRTLVGSCIAITLWNPKRRIGGMCHYMLPHGGAEHSAAEDGHYADGALRFFLRRIRAAGTEPADYEAKLFGGGSMFYGAMAERVTDIGALNIEAGKQMLQTHGFAIVGGHTAGSGHRDVILDLESGEVWVRHVGRSQ